MDDGVAVGLGVDVRVGLGVDVRVGLGVSVGLGVDVGGANRPDPHAERTRLSKANETDSVKSLWFMVYLLAIILLLWDCQNQCMDCQKPPITKKNPPDYYRLHPVDKTEKESPR